ncbi:MAG: ATP-binding cassette domain-containing protein [Planctomycetes bacterium]|nr:ATP-binding cassette domain-containing protein [Planctomycetota bacterium]
MGTTHIDHESEPLIAFSKVEVSSPGFNGPLLEHVSFTLHAGQSLVLSGPAGNGKSTAIGLVMGGGKPTAGLVSVFGRHPHLLDADDLDAMRARIGYVPQNGGLLSNLLLTENISLPLRYHRAADDATVRTALSRVQTLLGIEDLPAIPSAIANLRLRRLAALAKALILEPRLLILDEPTRDLAGFAKLDFWKLLSGLQTSHGIAILAATSDAETAYALGGQVISLPARHHVATARLGERSPAGTGVFRPA